MEIFGIHPGCPVLAASTVCSSTELMLYRHTMHTNYNEQISND